MTSERPQVLLHRVSMAASRGESDREAEREILHPTRAGEAIRSALNAARDEGTRANG